MTSKRLCFAAIIGLFFFSLSCNETLPVYTSPTNILAINVTTIEQLGDRAAPPGHQAVRIDVTGKNIFDEVFQDSVDIKGSVRIWWKRKPQRFRTIYLTEKNFKEKALLSNDKLLLVPGQQFTLETVWNMKTDDSLYLATDSEMDFSFYRKRPYCGENIKCAEPEEFIIETSVNIYDRLGYIAAPPVSFTFVAKGCDRCGVGPVCPPPPAGCGSQEP